jgi:hypothetical protein
MTTRVHRHATELPREAGTWAERWEGLDGGLITCWEAGRVMATSQPQLVARARAGELLVLPWKGGVERTLKNRRKFGSMYYLAMWQGLRGDDLDIDRATEAVRVCTRYSMEVTFTPDESKYRIE